MEQIAYITFGALLAISGTLLSEKLKEIVLRRKLLELFAFEIAVNLRLVKQDSYDTHVFLSEIYSNYVKNLHLISIKLREALLLHYKWVQEYDELKAYQRSGSTINRKDFENAVKNIYDVGQMAVDQFPEFQKKWVKLSLEKMDDLEKETTR